jgi:uridine kinase
MRGDKLIIEAHHRAAAEEVAVILEQRLGVATRPFVVSIGGESGSGKSELGRALADVLGNRGIRTLLLQQDDYFHLPPKANDRRRREDISWVGPGEVRLDLLDTHLAALREGTASIQKPLIDYDMDEASEEKLALGDARLIVVEGTYTSLLENVDARVFIDRTYVDTAEARRRRARDAQDDFVERVLEVEHAIIKEHIGRADIIVTSDYAVVTGAREH